MRWRPGRGKGLLLPWAPAPSSSPLDLRAIAAMGEKSRIIGYRGGLPWHLPEDRGYFMRLTSGHLLIMGRRTYEETGAALPGRRSLVVSSTISWSCWLACLLLWPESSLPDAEVVRSVPEALVRARQLSEEEEGSSSSSRRLITWVAGGGSIYRECFEHAPLLYLTMVREDEEEEERHPPGRRGEEAAFFPEDWATHYPLPLASWAGSSTEEEERLCRFTVWGRGP